MSAKLLIIGLGWLGLPFALDAISKGYKVYGSSREAKKRNLLSELAIESQLFALGDPPEISFPKTVIENAVVVINIPPGRKDFSREWFVHNMKTLFQYSIDKGAEKIIFVSTTSVFGDLSGIICNSTKPNPISESGLAHVELEDFLLDQDIIPAHILRLSGLVGPTYSLSYEGVKAAKMGLGTDSYANAYRHPIFHLAKKQNHGDGQTPVNLVHLKDVTNTLFALLAYQGYSQAFNLSAPQHPSRSEYYSWCAEQLKLGKLNFTNKPAKLTEDGKLIDASETLETLSINLQYPSPYDMLP